MDVKEILQNSSDALLNFFRNAVDGRYEEKIALAVAHQKEEDVCCAIAILLEMKTPENEIMRMLSKFYGIDSIAAVTELVATVKVVNQVNALTDYLNELGMSRVEVANYLIEHRVRAHVQTDSKLRNMAIDKLKAYFDKH